MTLPPARTQPIDAKQEKSRGNASLTPSPGAWKAVTYPENGPLDYLEMRLSSPPQRLRRGKANSSAPASQSPAAGALVVEHEQPEPAT